MITFVLIGAGSRGMIYSRLAHKSGRAQVVALAEPDEGRRSAAGAELDLPAEQCFRSADELFARGKIADACIVASMDRSHYAQAMRALELGYDLLLEKPISPDPMECLAIREKAREAHRKVVVCHVLRYTPFFRALKELTESGRFGRLIDIQHNENIGNFHMAHSFVRGNWRNSAESSPIILQKTCHDMDILTWLTGSECKRLSSFGSLRYFRPENAPAGSAKRCLECPAAADCRFDARKCYLPVLGDWPADVVCLEQTESALMEALRTGPYGRCVYQCDNDVCDHQVAVMEFADGVTATFNMSAFTNRVCRTVKLMFEDGEVRGNDRENVIEMIPFASNANAAVHAEVLHPQLIGSGHGGGDFGIMEDFLSQLEDSSAEPVSSIERSVESHFMSFAAEQSRLTGEVIDMDAYRAGLLAQYQHKTKENG
ncbi:MAG: Gfo/Idh/MocA family oxidoreductase [Eubacteriales bacterium]|nr:Gfo/Idh/MocA family oxidoreductase [Eubacteriales bacterium]